MHQLIYMFMYMNNYYVYPKYLDILFPYHTCQKLERPILLLVNVSEIAG